MSERSGSVRLRRWRPRGLAWSVALFGALAMAVLIGRGPEQLTLASPDRSRVAEVRSTLAGLPRRPAVLIGMDGDLGTYPEIRPAVRALVRDLLSRGARLATVSFTPEGRAIAAAEVDRLVLEGIPAERIADLGFVAGAEAGLVLAVTDLPEGEDGALARIAGAADRGIAAFDLVVVVGGIDFGPRSWVEQVNTRLPALPLIGVVPTFAYPDTAPYLRTGQLDALLGTVRDDAAYVADVAARVALDPATAGHASPSPVPMLLGMVVALVVMGGSAMTRGRRIGEEELEPEGAE